MAGAEGSGQAAARTPHFDVVLRGYNQRQVNERVTRLEFDLKNSNRRRDAATAQVNELTKLLNNTRAELDKVKSQLANIANSPVNASNVTERVRVMMSLAEEEIAEIRKTAMDQANATMAEAERHVAEQKATQQRLLGETEERRKQLEAQHQQRSAELEKQYEQRRAELETEHQELRTKLTQEHEALLAEVRAEQERVTTEFDAKTAELEERRTQLEQKYSKYHDDLDSEYDGLRAALTKEHQQLLVEAKAEAERIAAEAEERRIAAEKTLDESLAAKKAETEKLIAELESDALTKAEHTTTEASEQAEKIVREANEHADKRLAEVDERTKHLETLHQTLTEQFAAAQTAVAQAVSSLKPTPTTKQDDEPAVEANPDNEKTKRLPRPRTDRD
jgi:DNA repair exonuclease SbcCD ATPase subunit